MSDQKDTLRYDLRGVSASKSEVHAAIKDLDKGLFPKAFCKILPDVAAGSADHVNIMHADTAGTKTSLAYLYWKETGDLSVWEGIIQDAIVMNIDDMACVGCIENIILSSTIGRNKNLIPGEVITTLIQGTQKFLKRLADLGIDMVLAGGETADVGDIVRTVDVGYTAFARMPKQDVVDNNILSGDYIVGFASYGQATYEDAYNGGMGSNGLTSARHDLFSKYYSEKYPESFDPNTPDEVVYLGSKKLTDTIQINGTDISIGKLVLSPTRTYMPVIKDILEVHRKDIGGIIHCTGGAQTKVMKFLKTSVRIIKDNLLPIPPLFELIRKESGLGYKEMYQVFNMGHRLEVYVRNEKTAEALIEISNKYNIEAQIIGRVEAADEAELVIRNNEGEYTYA